MFFHYTRPDNIDEILGKGLQIGREPEGGKGLEWVLEFYDENPVYLTLETSEFIEAYREALWAGHACFEVETIGLSLVADIPSLVDKGAKYDGGLLYVGKRAALEPLLPFADEYGWIQIEHLIDPNTDVSAAAIKVTGTAACLSSIPPGRLTLRAPSMLSRPKV